MLPLDPLIGQHLDDQTCNPRLEARLYVWADLRCATFVKVEISTGILSFLLATEICPSVEMTVMVFLLPALCAGWTASRRNPFPQG